MIYRVDVLQDVFLADTLDKRVGVTQLSSAELIYHKIKLGTMYLAYAGATLTRNIILRGLK